MKKIITALVCTLSIVALYAQAVREIAIDFNQEKGAHNKFYKECIGAGRANEGLRADWQEQLKQVKSECDFKYIRFHGVFHDDMGVYFEDENGKPIYNWQYIDKLYDYILEIGMKPFVEMSFTPAEMTDGTETVFWWKGNINPPRSWEMYHNFIKAFTQHLTNRYGKEEVKTWYFEVWNEPNLHFFFSGTQEQYFEMYKQAVTAVREVCRDYRVGGPASAGAGWVKENLEYCEKNDVPIDFIATHAYNVHGFLDEFGKSQLILGDSPNGVIDQIQGAYNHIKASHNPEAELHITEWSSSYSPRDPIHDTYQNATFVLHTLKKTEPITTSMSYWVFTDIFEESGVPQTPFHGGFGLMNMQGIKKPTYFVYEYLNQMGDTELVNADTNSWACKQGDDIQLLLWDFTYTKPKQGQTSNQVYFRQKHESESKGKVALNFSNLKDGPYKLTVYKTGYKHNDVFTAYYELGLPSQLTKPMVEQLKGASANEPVEQIEIKVKNGKLSKDLDLYENDIYLVTLNKL